LREFSFATANQKGVAAAEAAAGIVAAPGLSCGYGGFEVQRMGAALPPPFCALFRQLAASHGSPTPLLISALFCHLAAALGGPSHPLIFAIFWQFLASHNNSFSHPISVIFLQLPQARGSSSPLPILLLLGSSRHLVAAPPNLQFLPIYIN